MDAQDRRAALVRGDRGGQARRQRARLRVRIAEDASERALAREADEHGAAERNQLGQASHELEVLLHRLPEADSGVEHDALLVDAGVDGEPKPLLEEGDDVGHDVLVVGLFLPVHQADPGAGLRYEVGHRRVGSQSRHVVDELRAERECAPRDLRLGGVDRHGHAVEPLEHRDDTAQLLVQRHGLVPGTRGLPADVHDRRTLLDHAARRRDGVVRVEVHAAIGERVRRHVDDAHHRWAREET